MMNKAILLSIQPKHLVNILNGSKTLELRKTVPKDYKGWVYIYCTKGKKDILWKDKDKYYTNHYLTFTDSAEVLNSKVVARFWFDETYYIKQAVNVYGDELNQISIYDSYGWKAPKEQQEILKQLCLTEQEVLDYVKGKGANAWHIKKLEIFDKPKELSDFYKLQRPPQSWQYVYTKELEELVNRDTPKRIKYENNGIPYCAVCERSYLRDVRGNQNRFCGYCGQRLDWRRKKND